MVNAFYNYKGMVYAHSVPRDQTINVEYYITILETLMREYIAQESKLSHCKNGDPISNSQKHLNNPPTIQMWPSATFLYPTKKKDLKRRCFDTEQDAVKALEAILKRMTKDRSPIFSKHGENGGICLNREYIEEFKRVPTTNF